MCCQFSVIYFKYTQFSCIGTYYNIFFGYVETHFFFVGALNRNVKMYHAVAGLFVSTANHPGGLTVGHSLWKLNP